jgi:type IV secretory pathway TrbL component
MRTASAGSRTMRTASAGSRTMRTASAGSCTVIASRASAGSRTVRTAPADQPRTAGRYTARADVRIAHGTPTHPEQLRAREQTWRIREGSNL